MRASLDLLELRFAAYSAAFPGRIPAQRPGVVVSSGVNGGSFPVGVTGRKPLEIGELSEEGMSNSNVR